MKNKALNRIQMNQALASTRIEGHVPSAEFLADCDRVVAGEMTTEQMRAASLARALAKDAVASPPAEPVLPTTAIGRRAKVSAA